MNKKTIKIAGWALGLSMAVAGIGAVTGMPKKPSIETRADGPFTYTIGWGEAS
ncbi:MAG: hypothetical protein IJS52_05540 [Bacilli bacterium]|nr:hypothetical protein [Bacilli bacterium]